MAEKAKVHGYRIAGKIRSVAAVGSTSLTIAILAASILRDPRTNDDQKYVAFWVLKNYPKWREYRELLAAVPDPKPPPIR